MEKLDHQLCALLWQSIEPNFWRISELSRPAIGFWKKARSVFANDIQRLYDFVQKLATLKQYDHDMISYVSISQSAVEELKVSLEANTLEGDFEHVHDQILTCQKIPSMENLVTRLLRIPSSKSGGSSSESIESFAMVSSRGGRRGCGNRGWRGRGGRSGCPQCPYCKRMGHSQEHVTLFMGSQKNMWISLNLKHLSWNFRKQIRISPIESCQAIPFFYCH